MADLNVDLRTNLGATAGTAKSRITYPNAYPIEGHYAGASHLCQLGRTADTVI